MARIKREVKRWKVVARRYDMKYEVDITLPGLSQLGKVKILKKRIRKLAKRKI
jgi:hypothetical protein